MGFCLDTSLSDWLYYLVFALAWFLLGFGMRHYVFTGTKRHDAGTTVRGTPADTEDGTDTMADYSSLWEPGIALAEWDFPLLLVPEHRFSMPTASLNAIGIHGANGRTVAVCAV